MIIFSDIQFFNYSMFNWAHRALLHPKYPSMFVASIKSSVYAIFFKKVYKLIETS
jgi:hypothetical protein